MADPTTIQHPTPAAASRTDAPPHVDIRNLTKRFSGGITAVDGVSLAVRPGEVLGFLGPNGAGKSTTMKMVTGYLTPTSGSAHVRGIDVTKDPIAAKRLIGYLPEGAPAYADMTPASFLSFIASVRGYSGAQRQRRIDLAIERTNLRGVLAQPIETLSKGFKRRVGLAQAILHEPDVLIMDEPTDGLDPNQKHEVRNLIRSLATGIDSGGGNGSRSGRAIILSTHILEEVEAVCTRAVVIAKGKIVADDTPLGLASRSRYHNAVTLAVITGTTQPVGDANADAAREGLHVAEALRSVVGVASVENVATSAVNTGTSGQHRVTCTVIPKNAALIQPEISRLLKSKGWQVEAMRLEAGRLDDVFRELTRGTGGSHEHARTG